MSMPDSPETVRLVLCSFPNEDSATDVCRSLVEEHLAACATLLPGPRSWFHWQGSLQEACEVLVLLKTTPECYPALEAELARMHPYDTPEILAIPCAAALTAYASWVQASCVLPTRSLRAADAKHMPVRNGMNQADT